MCNQTVNAHHSPQECICSGGLFYVHIRPLYHIRAFLCKQTCIVYSSFLCTLLTGFYHPYTTHNTLDWPINQHYIIEFLRGSPYNKSLGMFLTIFHHQEPHLLLFSCNWIKAGFERCSTWELSSQLTIKLLSKLASTLAVIKQTHNR